MHGFSLCFGTVGSEVGPAERGEEGQVEEPPVPGPLRRGGRHQRGNAVLCEFSFVALRVSERFGLRVCVIHAGLTAIFLAEFTRS